MGEETVEKGAALPPPQGRRGRTVLLGLVIFLCGCVCGASVMTLLAARRLDNFRRHGLNTEQAFSRLRRTLDLNEAQSAEVRGILKRGIGDLREVRRKVSPEVDDTLSRIRAEVAGVLDERQRPLWETRFDTMRERWFPSPGPL